jgi:phosphatidylglycerol:prolipoprotein diacylglycerol transferase
LLFFVRDNLIVSFLGLNWGLKQAQWTSLVLFIALLPITYLVLRYSKRIPAGEVAATYGIPQKEKVAVATASGEPMEIDPETPVAEEGSENGKAQEDEEPIAETKETEVNETTEAKSEANG